MAELCSGDPPLGARTEPWMDEWLDAERLRRAVQKYGSPLNLVCTEPMAQNISALNEVADQRGLGFRVYFARKSNKCLCFIDQAKWSGIGVDTASENELQQTLNRGIGSSDLVCTAAIKDESLIQRCIAQSICMMVDNQDELAAVADIAARMDSNATVAIRIGGFAHRGEKMVTRFGFDADRDRNIMAELSTLPVRVAGIHFHLDGFEASHRVSAIEPSLGWIKQLRGLGHDPQFLDIGGGVPVSYLNDRVQWNQFWSQHKQALVGDRPPVTYRNHSLGLSVHRTEVFGEPNVYPSFQSPDRADWLASLLDTRLGPSTVADQIKGHKIQLRCEPGRSLMDGCGMTVARVEFRKRNADGDWLIGLSMNRTQCRTTHDDFLVDPILVPTSKPTGDSMSGFLVGAYCTESELLSLRRMRFPQGIQRGDLIVFPNTAGYQMHFLESRSHQFPLAKNIVVTVDSTLDPKLDLIDRR